MKEGSAAGQGTHMEFCKRHSRVAALVEQLDKLLEITKQRAELGQGIDLVTGAASKGVHRAQVQHLAAEQFQRNLSQQIEKKPSLV